MQPHHRRVPASLLLSFGLGLAAACTTPSAYGPSGDERLAMAVEDDGGEAGVANTEHLADIQRNACGDVAPLVAQLQTPPDPGAMEEVDGDDEDAVATNLEEEHLAALTGAVRELRSRRGNISDILLNRPDLRFFNGQAADGMHYDIPEVLRVCDQVIEEAELALDAFIRELLSMPILSEVERVGRQVRTVPRERVDFALLGAAVQILAPFDADSLMSRVEAAKSRLEEEQAQAQRPAPRRRR
jgi:hypothetical protein